MIHDKKTVCVLLGISFLCLILYRVVGDAVGRVSFFPYMTTYHFSLKNILFLAPGIFCFSLVFASTVLFKPFKSLYSLLMHCNPVLLLTAMCVVFVTAAAAVSCIVLDGVPHVQDSIVQYFQAKVFAAGRLTVPSPARPEFFDMQFVLDRNGVRFGKYLFGQSVFPWVGLVLGVPWLINPVLGGISLVLIYLLAKDLFGDRTARLATLLVMTSPFYLFLHSSFLSHPQSLLCITLCILCALRMPASGDARYPLTAGAAFGLAFNIRPLSAVLISFPVLIFVLVSAARRPRLLRKLILFSLPALVMLSCFLLYNKAVFGDYLTTGYELYDPHSGFGFGPEKGEATISRDGHTRPGHTPFKGLKDVVKMGFALSKDLFGWPDLSLLFVVLLFLCSRTDLRERLLAASLVCFAAGYFFYWGTGYSICFGPRYYLSCVPMLVLLTARGMEKTAAGLQSLMARTRWGRTCNPAGAIGMFVIVLCCLNFFVHLPGRIQLYGNRYWNVDTALVSQVREQDITNALVFVESGYYRGTHSGTDYYNATFLHNDVWLAGDVIYARDMGPEKNRTLMEDYPDRSVYLFRKTAGGNRHLVKWSGD